jgi:predicted component of type VI protein secretion system
MSPFLLNLGDMRFPLRMGETLLGRSPYCSIVLADPKVSREHAAIRVSTSGLVIQDLGSRNGTRVNGERLAGERALEPGDRIEIGNQRMRIEASSRSALRGHPLASTGEHMVPDEVTLTPTVPRAQLGSSPEKRANSEQPGRS